MTKNIPSSPGSLPTLLSSPEIDIANAPRLSSSIWNKDLSPKPSRLLSSARPVKLSAKIDLFSSDPIASTDLGANHLFNKIPFSEQPRKRGVSPTILSATQPSKMVKIAAPCTIKHTFETAIFEARDLLVKAYGLTNDKIKQAAVLDLVQVFRSFTEEGKVITIVPKSNEGPDEPNHEKDVVLEAPKPPSYAQKLREGIPQMLTTKGLPSKPGMKVLGHKAPIQDTAPAASPNKTPTTNNISVPHTAARVMPIAIATNSTNENVITLVTRTGCTLPSYQAYTVRENINKILGKRAVSRVHTSPKGNLVLSCMDATPAELLLDQEKWQGQFEGWPIKLAQKINHWPKMVVHGVATCIPINKLNSEIEAYNKDIKTQGEPRWLTKSPEKMIRASVAFCVKTDEEKTRLIKSGVLIGGQLLKVVNFQQSTQKTQCRKCLQYGHHSVSCRKLPVCAICLGAHYTNSHKCSTCSATQSCIHHAVQCANCKSNTHLAFQRLDCDYYKALTC